MQDIDGTSPEGLTRREALKRGAAFGGALLWATPVVQAIGMSRAVATETSGNCKHYCIKYEFTGGDGDLLGRWSDLGRGSGNCMTCPRGYNNDDDAFPEGFLREFEVFDGSRKEGVWVRYPDSCSLADLEDPSPDEFYPGAAAAAKCGRLCGFVQWDTQVPDPDKRGFNKVFIPACNPPNGPAISHIELIIQCCP